MYICIYQEQFHSINVIDLPLPKCMRVVCLFVCVCVCVFVCVCVCLCYQDDRNFFI